MNAAEARRRRGGSTLVERVKRDPVRAARIDALVAAATVEQMVQAIMDSEQITAAELARRVNAKAPQISRDLHGGLSRATLTRLVAIAEALGYDFVPAFVPRSDLSVRRRFFAAYDRLIPETLKRGARAEARRTKVHAGKRTRHKAA